MSELTISDQLVLIRTRIRSKGKEKEISSSTQLDYFKSYELVLDTISNATTKNVNTQMSIPALLTLAHEVLGELIKSELAMEPRLSLPYHDLPFFIRLSNSLQWESPYFPVVARCRTTLSLLLKLAQALQIPLYFYLQQQLLGASFHSKRSLAVFGALVTVLPVSEFEKLVLLKEGGGEAEGGIASGVFRRILVGIDRDDVALASGKLATRWIQKIEEEEPGSNKFWIDPVLTSLLGCSPRRRKNLGKYILPSLLTKGRVDRLKTLLEVGGYIVEEGIQKIEEAMIIIEVAYSAGLVELAASDSTRSGTTFLLPLPFLSSAIHHFTPSIRISALNLVVLSKATNTPLPDSTFPLLQDFYTYSIGEEDRDCSVESAKLLSTLLVRLCESSKVAYKKEDMEYLTTVQYFLEWLASHFILNLSPSKPFRIQHNSIRYLGILLEAQVDNRFCSTSITSTWPFNTLDILTPKTTFVLLRLLVSTYSSLREGSIQLLDRFPSPLPGYEEEAGTRRVRQDILLPALGMIKSGREAESSAGSEIIGFVWRKWAQEGESWRLGEIGDWSSQVFTGPGELNFISELMDLADIQLDAHEKNFGRAASQSPMHGTFLTLRHLFSLVPKSIDRAHYRALSLRALQLVERVWKVTSIVLAADPMGELGIDTEEARALNSVGNDIPGEEMDVSLGGPRHKIILSSSWRAFKQAAELLESILLWPSNLPSEEYSQFWSFSEISSIGRLFAMWLIQIRHRGAYMATYSCYAHINEVLIRQKWPEVEALTAQWLSDQLDAMAKSENVSITRKSAGFRLCTLAGLSAVLPASPAAFTGAFDRIFDIVESEDQFVSDESRTHSMNTLEAVFSDTKTGGAVTLPYVERGFLLCVSQFNSPNWICRNAALMLFGALVTRTFGRTRINPTRTETLLIERLSLGDFFGRYPSLHTALVNHLNSFNNFSTSISGVGDNHLTGLYSVLLLLSLLKTIDDVSESSLILARPFVSLVQACGKSDIWKIRNASADALTALISPSAVIKTCLALLSDLKLYQENELHGRFIAALRLLQSCSSISPEDVQTVNTILIEQSHLVLGSRSFSTRATFLEIVITVAKKLDSSFENPLLPMVLQELEKSRSWTTRIACLPSAEVFITAAFTFVLFLKPTITLYKAGLVSPFLSVQRHTLTSLISTEAITRCSLFAQLIDMVGSETETEIKIGALEVLMKTTLPDDKECRRLIPILSRQLSETLSLPLRDSLSPFIARLRNQIQQVNDLDTYLISLQLASRSQESFESRNASLLSLSELVLPLIVKNKVYCRTLLLLLQDDDQLIRKGACQIVSKQWNKGMSVCELRGCEIVLVAIGCSSWEEDPTEELNEDFTSLANIKSQYFNVEKSNIYIDDTMEADFILNRESSSDSSTKILDEVMTFLARFSSSIFSDDSIIPTPFGLASNPLISKWARRGISLGGEKGVKYIA